MSNLDTSNSIKRVFEIFQSSDAEIRPHFILTGPSGCGKSFTIENLCEEMDIPMLSINAAQLTKEGTSGNSLSKALSPILHYGDTPIVCFVDEFDKLFISGNSNSNLAHETTNGVQNEFLKVLESDTTSVFGDYGKYLTASTKNILFVFAGAFNGETNISLDKLREFGIKTEFLGRVGITFELQKLTLEELENILRNSSLLAKYLKLFPAVNADVVVSVIFEAMKSNYEKNTLGARQITAFLHQYFINGSLQQKTIKKTTFQKTLTLPK